MLEKLLTKLQYYLGVVKCLALKQISLLTFDDPRQRHNRHRKAGSLNSEVCHCCTRGQRVSKVANYVDWARIGFRGTYI
jgi:hypothetical protein